MEQLIHLVQIIRPQVSPNFCCNLTGLKLEFKTLKKQTASLDRIDSTKGYVEGNVQWIHKDINLMKNRLPQDYFISMCDLISRHTLRPGV